MGPATKQDVQNIVETAKNRVLERAALRQDTQTINDTLRSVVTMVQQGQQQSINRQDMLNMADTIKQLLVVSQQSQQLLRQAEYQRLQLIRRTVALETRIAQFEQELRTYRGALNKMADSQPQQIFVPVPASNQGSEPQGQYAFRPA